MLFSCPTLEGFTPEILQLHDPEFVRRRDDSDADSTSRAAWHGDTY